MRTLDLAGFRFAREGVKIPYLFEGRRHYYLPDLIVYDKFGRMVALEEIKPRVRVNDPLNQAKFEAARTWCKAQGIPFVIITEDTLTVPPNLVK